jgi:hypothetical protein
MSKLLIGALTTFALAIVFARAALADPTPDPVVRARCVKLFERQHTCSDTFIPAWVDVRVASDQPAGIAARAKREGRAALIIAAKTEWAADSKDDAIAARCEQIASGPQGARLTAAGERCLAATDCAAFVSCVVPVLRDHLWHR